MPKRTKRSRAASRREAAKKHERAAVSTILPAEEYRMPQEPDIPHETYDMLKACLQSENARRLEVIHQPYHQILDATPLSSTQPVPMQNMMHTFRIHVAVPEAPNLPEPEVVLEHRQPDPEGGRADHEQERIDLARKAELVSFSNNPPALVAAYQRVSGRASQTAERECRSRV